MNRSGHPYANHRFLSSSVTHYIGLQIVLFDWGTILAIHSTVSVLSEITDIIKNKTKYSYKHKLSGQTLHSERERPEAIGTIRISACFQGDVQFFFAILQTIVGLLPHMLFSVVLPICKCAWGIFVNIRSY